MYPSEEVVVRAVVVTWMLIGGLAGCPAAEEVPVTSARWELAGDATRVETHLGREALFLRNATATLGDLDFVEGVIHLDVATSGARGFSGLRFHVKGDTDFEHVYVRPHQSGLPDACQYQPVFAGHAAWQIFHGPGFSGVAELPPDTWIPLTLVVAGDVAELHVNGELAVHVDPLLRDDPGGPIALVSGYAPVHVSNVRVEPGARLPLLGTAIERDPPPPGTVERWEVSAPYDESRVDGVTTLPDDLPGGWRPLEVEHHGIQNLARVQEPGGARTVTARVSLISTVDRLATLELAFSDRVRVFVNGALVFAGDDGYRTRDHRFLGTVGFHDAITFPLAPGPNRIDCVVSEDFGGWAIGARVVGDGIDVGG